MGTTHTYAKTWVDLTLRIRFDMIFTMRLNNIKTQNFWTILDLYTMYCMYCISYMVKGIFVPSPCITSDELLSCGSE